MWEIPPDQLSEMLPSHTRGMVELWMLPWSQRVFSKLITLLVPVFFSLFFWFMSQSWSRQPDLFCGNHLRWINNPIPAREHLYVSLHTSICTWFFALRLLLLSGPCEARAHNSCSLQCVKRLRSPTKLCRQTRHVALGCSQIYTRIAGEIH